ncbi:MAG: aspartate aminotransferase family protein [Eubacteriales bacterium]
MDPTIKRINEISPDRIDALNRKVMLGSGQHGICFTEGKGVRLRDITGKSYIDCTAQGWALLVGHANEEIRQTVYEQMGRLGHLNQNSDSLPRYALADKLTALAPAPLNRVLFTVGGSAAIEAAMKIAVKNVKGARKFVTLKDGYHGTSLTTGAASWLSTKTAGMFTGFDSFRSIVNDLFIRVPNPYTYRFDGTEEACVRHCLEAAYEVIGSGVVGPVAGVIVEPLQASGGQIPLPAAYLRGLRKLCDDMGALLIFDELQTYGRIGDWFAARKYEVEPDIICLGKSLGAGFPIAAVLVHDKVEGFGPLGEDVHTFSNNCIAQVAALKQIEIMERDGLLENTNRVGAMIAEGLHGLQQQYPQIGDIRQVGLHIGIEFVKDPRTKEPDMVFAQTVKHIALQAGLILGEAGYRMNVLKIKPPLIITPDEAKEALSLFAYALQAALQLKK